MSLLKEFEVWAFGSPTPISITNRWMSWMMRHDDLHAFSDEADFLNNYDQMMIFYLRENKNA